MYTVEKHINNQNKNERTPNQMDQEIINVIGYARESTEWQMDNTNGMEIQEDRIKEFCEKNNFNLVDIIKDEGISGGIEAAKRPGICKLLDMCSNPPIQFVIVDKIDRFSRNIYEGLGVEKLLSDNHVKILYSAQETLNEDNMQVDLLRHVLLAVAEFERKVIKNRLNDGKRKKSEKGNKPAGRMSYGYKYGDGEKGERKVTLVVPAEADVVRAIFTLRKHLIPVQTIAQYIELRKYSKFKHAHQGRNENKPWSFNIVRAILANEFYLGKFTYSGVEYQGNHEPIISQELWDDVRAAEKKYDRYEKHDFTWNDMDKIVIEMREKEEV